MGARPAPPDGRLRRLRGDHPAGQHARLPAVHPVGDPALEVVHREHQRRDDVGGLAGTADQADPVPEDRAAGRGHDRGHRRLRVRAHRARRDHAVLHRPDLDQPRVHPGHRRGAVRVHAGHGARGRVGQRVLPGPRQRAAPPAAAVVLPVAGPVQPVPTRGHDVHAGEPDPAGHRARQPVRDPVRVLPRRDLRHARRWTAAAELGALAALLLASIVLVGLTTILFKRLEPSFAKVL